MPIVSSDKYLTTRTALERYTQAAPLPEEAGFFDAVGAAFREENLAVNAARWTAGLFDDEDWVRGYTPFDDPSLGAIVGMFPEEFRGVDGPVHAQRVKRKLEARLEDQRVIGMAGGSGLLAMGTAMVFDPVNLIPIAPVVNAGRNSIQGVRAASGLARAAATTARSDDAVRLAASLNRWERAALREGAVSREAILAAKSLPGQLRTAAVVRAKTRSPEEIRALQKLEKVRARPRPSLDDLGDFYAARSIEAARRGESIPFVKQVSGIEDVTTETAKAQKKLTEYQQRLLEKGPTRDDLKGMYASVRAAEGAAPETLVFKPTIKEGQEEAFERLQRNIDALENEIVPEREFLQKLKGKDSPWRKQVERQIETNEATVTKLLQKQSELLEFKRFDIDPKTGLPSSKVTTADLEEFYAGWKARAMERGEQLPLLQRERELAEAVAQARFFDDARTMEKLDDAAEGLLRRPPNEEELLRFYEETQATRKKNGFRPYRTKSETVVLQELANARKIRMEDAEAMLRGSRTVVPIVRDGAGKYQRLATAELLEAEQRSAFVKIGKTREAMIAQARELAEAAERGPGALAGAVTGAKYGALQGGFEELALQAMQEGRDDELIANTFVAAGVMGLVFGSMGAGVGRYFGKRADQALEELAEELTFGDVLSRMPDADKIAPEVFQSQSLDASFRQFVDAAGQTSFNGAKLVNDNKVLRSLMEISPSGRLAKSKNKIFSSLAQVLESTPWLRRGTLGPSVRAHIMRHHSNANAIGHQLHEIARRSNMKNSEFLYGLSRALRTGELSETAGAEMKEAVSLVNKYFDTWKKDLLDLGLEIPDNLGADKFYLPRVYNFDMIRQEPGKFMDVLMKHGFSNDAARRMVKEVEEKGGLYDPDVFNFLSAGESGRLKLRQLRNIPSADLDEFLVNDVPWLIERYALQVGPQFEYLRLFDPNVSRMVDGKEVPYTVAQRLNLEPLKDAAMAEARRMADEAGDPAKASKIWDRFHKERADLDFVIQDQLGQKLEQRPFDVSARRFSNYAVSATSITQLGNAGFSSVTEMATASFVNGMVPFFRTVMRKMRRPLSLLLSKMEPNEIARNARHLEMAGAANTRVDNLFDFTADRSMNARSFSRRGTKFEPSATRKAHNTVMKYSGLQWITSVSRDFNITTTQDEIIRTLLGKGRMTKARRNLLSLSGISEDLGEKIKKELAKDGSYVVDTGVHLADTSKWSREVAEEFEAAVLQNSARGVMNPFRTETPMFYQNELGRVVTQYLQFPTDATTKILASGAQRLDANVVGGLMLMTTIGSLAYILEEAARGGQDRVDELDAEDVVANGVLRAGIPGLLGNAYQIGSRTLFKDLDPLNMALPGFETPFERYGPGSFASSVPAMRTMDDLAGMWGTVQKLVSGDDVTPQEARARLRTIPLAKAIWYEPVVNWTAEAIAD